MCVYMCTRVCVCVCVTPKKRNKPIREMDKGFGKFMKWSIFLLFRELVKIIRFFYTNRSTLL